MRILAVNAGSSTLKLSVVERADTLWSAEVPRGQAAAELAALPGRLDEVGGIDAVGHRVVHGGEHFAAPVRVTAEVRATVRDLSRLAPLHNPVAAAGGRPAWNAVSKHATAGMSDSTRATASTASSDFG